MNIIEVLNLRYLSFLSYPWRKDIVIYLSLKIRQKAKFSQ